MKIRGMRITLTLQNKSFPNGGNVKTIYTASLPNYLHADVVLQRMAGLSGNTAMINIYGMLLEDCFALTKLNLLNYQYENQVQIAAGYINVEPQLDGTYSQDDIIARCKELPVIYLGQVMSAGVNLNNPNRPFSIQSIFSAVALTTMVPPVSINEPQDLDVVVKSILQQYNATKPQTRYELISVYPTQIVNNAHYAGSAMENLQQLCDDYGYQFNLVPSNDITVIGITVTRYGMNTRIPSKQFNEGIKTLSAANGMIGYPERIPFGIVVKEYFDPTRAVGDTINLQTYYKSLDSKESGVNYTVWSMQSILQTHDAEWSSTLTIYDSKAAL